MAEQGRDISVIIPVYNRESTLHATLDSIAGQTELPGEIIIVDNNSTDGSVEVANDFVSKFKGCPVVIISCKARGASAARNAGVAVASGSMLLFFDSDDIMYPSLIATYCRALSLAENARVVVVPQHFRMLDGKLRTVNHPLHGDAVVSQILHTIVTTNNMLVQKSAFEAVGEWNEDLPSWNDWEFGLRLLLRFGRDTLFLHNVSPQLCHVLQEKSITGKGFSHHLDACLSAISAAETDIKAAPQEWRHLYEHLLAYKRVMLAAQASREGDKRGEVLLQSVLATLPSVTLRFIYRCIYRYISTGLPGGSRLALTASRIYLKIK